VLGVVPKTYLPGYKEYYEERWFSSAREAQATEIRLAAARGLPIVFVVFVDGSLNRIELKQMAQEYPSTATRIEDIDLVGLATAMDCDGVRAESTAELEKALIEVESLRRPLVVEARIDPSQYESQF